MSSTPTLAINEAVSMTLLHPDGEQRVPVTLGYRVSDPYAVSASFVTDEETVTWFFARELLASGLQRDSGLGDIRIIPLGGDSIVITLAPPGASAQLFASAPPIAGFLARTYALVPTGTESQHLDLDAELQGLLGRDASGQGSI